MIDDLERIPVASEATIRWLRGHHRFDDVSDIFMNLKGVGLRLQQRMALVGAGVSLARAAVMTDEQLLAIPGVGRSTLTALRRAAAS